jgi:hypothetical protein
MCSGAIASRASDIAPATVLPSQVRRCCVNRDIDRGFTDTVPANQPAVIDMRSYCRAGVDVAFTRTFAGEVAFEGTSGDPTSPATRWFPEPILNQKAGADGTFVGVTFGSSGSSDPSAVGVQHLRFDVDHVALRLRLTSVHSGQGGGTIQVILTPLPC